MDRFRVKAGRSFLCKRSRKKEIRPQSSCQGILDNHSIQRSFSYEGFAEPLRLLLSGF